MRKPIPVSSVVGHGAGESWLARLTAIRRRAGSGDCPLESSENLNALFSPELFTTGPVESPSSQPMVSRTEHASMSTRIRSVSRRLTMPFTHSLLNFQPKYRLRWQRSLDAVARQDPSLLVVELHQPLHRRPPAASCRAPCPPCWASPQGRHPEKEPRRNALKVHSLLRGVRCCGPRDRSPHLDRDRHRTAPGGGMPPEAVGGAGCCGRWVSY